MKRGELQGTSLEGEQMMQYADSDVSSPRSVGAGGKPPSVSEDPLIPVRWDDAPFTRVKLMCSYGGRILPRPHDNQLRYVGGESRIAVVSRNVSFADLTAKLSRMFGASVAVKYQLPYEDLDALISVTSDEDLEIMMEENDRLQQAARSMGSAGSSSSFSSPSRLRLFLFPTKIERSQTTSLSEMLESTQSREKLFVDILNGMPPVPRVRSETSSIISENPDFLFGLDALEEWAAAASYGAATGQTSSSSAVAAASTSNLPSPDKPPDLIRHGSGAFPALLGSLLHQHHVATHAGGETSSAPGSPLKTRKQPMGSSSSAPPAVISILSAMATAASREPPSNPISAPSPHIAVEIGSFGRVQEDESRRSIDCEAQEEPSSSVRKDSTGTNPAAVQDSEVSSEHLLPSELLVDEDLMQKPENGGRGAVMMPKEVITALPIYDEEDHPAAAPPPIQGRATRIEERQQVAAEEVALAQRLMTAKDDGVRSADLFETEIPAPPPAATGFKVEGASTASGSPVYSPRNSNPLPVNVQANLPVYHQAIPFSAPLAAQQQQQQPPPPPKVISKPPTFMQQQVIPASDYEAPGQPVIAPATSSTMMMMPKPANATQAQANPYQMHQQQQPQQASSMELDSATNYATQGPGIQLPTILTNSPSLVNPAAAAAAAVATASNLGAIASPAQGGILKQVYVGGQTAAAPNNVVMGSPRLTSQPIHTGPLQQQSPRVITTGSPQAVDHGALPLKAQQGPAAPPHHFQRAVGPVPVASSREAPYPQHYAPPTMAAQPLAQQQVTTMPSRFRGRPTPQQAPPTMPANMVGRAVNTLGPQYYYVVEHQQPAAVAGNLFFAHDAAAGIAVQPPPPPQPSHQLTQLVGVNPFMDDLHPIPISTLPFSSPTVTTAADPTLLPAAESNRKLQQ